MAEEYDIFISYRRFEDEARQKENISKAGRLSEVFARKGYKVFFDQNERTAKALKEKILPAVRNSRCFVLFLTEKCLERCKNEGDLVRQEIEEAKKEGKTIVPVTLDSAVEHWPNDLPESLRFLSDNGGIDITNIHNDTSYYGDIDALTKVVGEPKGWRKVSIVRVKTDFDCYIIQNGVILTVARKGYDNFLYLQKGLSNLKLEYETEEYPEVKDNMTIKISDNSTSLPDIKLSKKVKEYIEQQERKQKEIERKKREDANRKKKEREKNGEFEVGGVIFNMVSVRGGEFKMGATDEQGNDKYESETPVHKVKLHDFKIGETVVTQGLWKAVMGSNPSQFKGSDDLPVEQVSWEDAQKFIGKLNQETGRTFRLPTETEWEYAARGGRKSMGYKYSGSKKLDDVAWYGEQSGGQTYPVKWKNPNELGLYDMSGNVWEWCQDWYGDYSKETQTNPQGPAKGEKRVRRGGGYDREARACRVTSRSCASANFKNNNQGFRIVLDS